MVGDELNVLSAFLAVAEERSFTRAAKRLGVSQSALSHAIRGLEERIGVRLLTRTTRSVAPTEAGEQMIAHLGPALADIRGTLDRISGLRERPAGRVRLLVPQFAVMIVVAPKLGQFALDYPDVVLEVERPGGEIDVYLLDPKYKLDSEAESATQSARPKKVDIDTMHAYRDSIRDDTGRRVVRFAATLYPGPTVDFGPGLEAISAVPSQDEELNARLRSAILPALVGSAG